MVKDYRRKICFRVDVLALTDKNILLKDYSKYEDREIEVEKMWYLKTTTEPVIVWSVGMIKRETDKLINNIHDSPSQCKIQKIVLCRTAHFNDVCYKWDWKISSKKRRQKR